MANLTTKQEKFVKKTISTLNPTEAVRQTYDLGAKGGSKELKQREQTARAIASENLTKPNIKKAFKEALADLDDQALVDELYKLALESKDLGRTKIDAIKTILIDLKGYGADKKIKVGRLLDDIQDLVK